MAAERTLERNLPRRLPRDPASREWHHALL